MRSVFNRNMVGFLNATSIIDIFYIANIMRLYITYKFHIKKVYSMFAALNDWGCERRPQDGRTESREQCSLKGTAGAERTGCA